MLKNYFRIAYRNLIRHADYTVINVAGLALGIAVCMVIFLVIRFQNSFDDFHPNGQRIYRILTSPEGSSTGAAGSRKSVPFPMASGLQTTFPQLEAVTPVYASHNDVLQVLNSDGFPVKNFKEQDGVFYTDPSFFRMFHFPLLAGSYASLKDPNNVLLTKETAERYFGDWRSAMGKTIRQTATYRIGSGLFQSPPLPLKVSGVLATTSMSATMGSVQEIWERTFPELVYEYRFLDDKIAGFYKQENQLAELYKIFAAIAVFLSCLGLYGLASFMAVQRTKEVGIRKVLGASAGSIVYLFSREFVILIAIAFAIAAPIAWYYMHQWLQDFAYRIHVSWWLFAAGGLAAVIIALSTISFQAFKAAMANPIKSLRME